MLPKNWAYPDLLIEKALCNLNVLLKKKKICKGKVIGYHGTSASRAKSIGINGFRNSVCVEGHYGVWFWDEDYRNNSIPAAQDKSKEDGDLEYAIIKAELDSPIPDLSPLARPQWRATKDRIKILGVEYVPINQRPKFL